MVCSAGLGFTPVVLRSRHRGLCRIEDLVVEEIGAQFIGVQDNP